MRDARKMLKDLYRKKPAVAALMDSYQDMSVEQIMAADQPLWIRETLVKFKKSPHGDKNAHEIADAMTQGDGTPIRVEKQCEVRRWTSHTQLVKTGRVETEIQTGDLILILEPNHQIRTNRILSTVSEFDMYEIFLNTELVGFRTEPAFLEMVNQLVLSRS